MRTRTQKNLKRIISLALTFAMFCSLLPTIAFAEDQELIKFKNMKMAAF